MSCRHARVKRSRADRRQKRHPVLRAVGRTMAVLGVTLLGILATAYGAVALMCKGPSPTARDMFVTTMMETSAAKFVPRLFLSGAEIEAILHKNTVIEGETNTEAVEEFVPRNEEVPKDTIELLDVYGPTFKGKMMIVHDPSRIKVATLDRYGADLPGLKVEDFAKKYGATAAVNGGEFLDTNGVGKGGQPLGIVIKDGEFRYGNESTVVSIITFDDQDRLLVGRMSGKEAKEKHVRDAISYGPAFIVNGEPLEVSGTGGGLNPRTVIGQRADGAVLLLAIDGRQTHSLGASFKDCIDVMMEYGAINAANLDGGSSTMMVYKGETVNSCASMYGSRRLPTAIIVE